MLVVDQRPVISDNLIENSSLLIGTKWGFTKSSRVHVHYTAAELKQSAEDCHLCHLLLESAKLVDLDRQASVPTVLNQTDDPPRSPNSKDGAASHASHNLAPTARPSSSNRRERLYVNVRQTKSPTGHPCLSLRLSGNAVVEAKSCLIHEIHNGKPPFVRFGCC